MNKSIFAEAQSLRHMRLLIFIIFTLSSVISIYAAVSVESFYDGYQPSIFKVTPNYGSTLGGTSIRIYGTNFQPSGLFSQVLVFVGENLCTVNAYYTTNEQITCTIPACTADACISQLESVYPYVSVGINVYVYTVQGTFNAQSTFYYQYWYTPYITSMTRNMWSTSTGDFIGWMYTDALTKISVTFGGYNADLGTDDELNDDDLTFTSTSSQLYYYVPSDIPSGFYNATITLSNIDAQFGSYLATGYANFFANKELRSLYTSSMSGVPYLVGIYPMISSISPSHGSLAGGTTITISGSGFINDTSTLRVIVGGVNCQVLTASVESITCITDQIASTESIIQSINSYKITKTEPYEYVSSSYGSPGIWIKIFYVGDSLANKDGVGSNNTIALGSFPWREGANFNFWYNYGGSYWNSYIGLGRIPLNFAFGAQAGTTFVAPVTGYYTFYIAMDDYGKLYGSFTGIGVSEFLLATVPSYTTSYYKYASQISSQVYLEINQRLYLRARWINTGYNDYFSLAVEFEPAANASNVNVSHSHSPTSPDGTNSSSTLRDVFDRNFDNVDSWSDTLLRHASKREIQTITFSFSHTYEKQMISISSALSGSFYLIVQNAALTSAIDLKTMKIADITSKLRAAVIASIPSASIQCQYFGGYISKVGNNYQIVIEFQTDTTEFPLTLLQVYKGSLTGYSNMTISVTRLNQHSTLPKGTFNMFVNEIAITKIPFYATASTLQDAIKSVDFTNDVVVSGYVSSITGGSWTITFVRPRGDNPQITLDTSGISGPDFTYSVETIVNGSATALFWDPIPLWMTEIPIEWAAGKEYASSVEIFQNISSTTGGYDVVKAICDGSVAAGTDQLLFSGQAKGDETTCAYHYFVNDTAIVTGFNMTQTGGISFDPTYYVSIVGEKFLLTGNTSAVQVSIGGASCSVIKVTDRFINCSITQVPWGTYRPSVTIVGYGYAVVSTNETLSFDQVVLSISPSIGSYAGGQLITITGYGFHTTNTTVTLSPGGTCIIESVSYSVITCRTPALPKEEYPTELPTSAPTLQPTVLPSNQPTVEPTAEPSIEPSVVPTNVPSPLPSSSPSNSPTFLPSREPSSSPSAEQSQFPSKCPTSEPSAIVSSLPTQFPTAPSSIPTVLPTAFPSTEPSYLPSSSITAFPTSTPSSWNTTDPSASPSLLPSAFPTASPSTESSNLPSSLPTVIPTFVPSFESSFCPSTDPTTVPSIVQSAIPSAVDTTEPSSVSTETRRLTPSSVVVAIYINNIVSSIDFEYSEAYTPIVTSISPSRLSTAVSTTVTIRGSLLYSATVSNSTVTIGSSSCIVKNITDSLIECFYVRSKGTAVSDVNLVIYVNGKGYAAASTDISSLPSVTVGFEIYSISPSLGSIYGGTYVLIQGFGFSYNEQTSGTVVFTDSVGSTTYSQLIQYLGLTDYTITKHYQNCNIQSVNFTTIYCQISELTTPIQVADNTLLATLTISNLTPYYKADSSITLIQSLNATPIINYISAAVTTIDSDILQNTTFTVTGTLLLSNQYASIIQVGGTVCTYDESSASSVSVSVKCPNLAAGNHTISFLSPSYGLAALNHNNTVNVPLSFEAFYFSTTVGSVAGGTSFQIVGKGFEESSCDWNTLSFTLSNGYTVLVTLTSCSTGVLVGITPSLVGVSGSLDSLSAYTKGTKMSVVSASLVVHGYKSKATSSVGSSYYVSGMNFTYSTDYSPQVYYLTPIKGYVNTQLSIGILSFFGVSTFNDYSVTIGGVSAQCSFTRAGINLETVTNKTMVNTTGTCYAPAVSYATYPVYINLVPYGYAVYKSSTKVSIPKYTSNIKISNYTSRVFSSVAGGYDLDINGEGLSTNLTVTVCGLDCPVVNASYYTAYCSTPAHVTVEYVNYLLNSNISIDLIETIDMSDTSKVSYFGYQGTTSISYSVKNLFDYSYSTYWYSYSTKVSECSVGIQMVGNYRVMPYRLRYYPIYQYASSMGPVYFEGSNDGKNYTILGTLTTSKEGWNYITATGTGATSWYKYLRYHATTDALSKTYFHCPLAEIRFLGTVASTIITCPVKVWNGIRHFFPGYLNYSVEMTPIVYSLSPMNGTSLGNTSVTLYGQFTGTSLSATTPTVILNSINCTVQSYSTTHITCITGYRSSSSIQTKSLKVTIPGIGDSVSDDSLYYTYVDKWSALTTWKNQEPPVAGDFVVIPDGQSILLDESTPELLFLLVQGELYFDSTKPVLTLDVHYFFVYGGQVYIGTEDVPYESNVTITLHGKRYDDIDVPEIGSKTLCVASKNLPKATSETGIHVAADDVGRLEIHGKKRLRTWTRLNTTVYSGDTIIKLAERVDFAAGESIAFAGTGLPGSSYRDEVRVVSQNLDGYTIVLTEPLLYDHFAEIVNIDGRIVDLRGEVGLLTRNIVIQGDSNSDYEIFGAQVVARYSSIFRVENAELRKCGQAFVLGRYCLHSHKAGNMETSYVKANSIHHSYQRAVTTHSTFYWEVRDNVAYNVLGHAYFIEDGNEQYNTLSGNLGILTKKSSASLSSDLKPATFWTSNPTNFWYDNAAANSDNNGFWFELPSVPNNYLANGYKYICPVHAALGAFKNNTFHSCSSKGLRIYPEWTPYTDTGCTTTTPAAQYLEQLTAFHNGDNGLFSKRHGDLHHWNVTSLLNGGHDINIVKYTNVDFTNDPNLLNAVVVGALNPSSISYNLGKYGVFLPQQEYFYIKNVKFVNYGSGAAMAACNGCDDANEFAQGGFTSRTEGLKFINSSTRFYWAPHKKEIIHDLDGTLTGTTDSMLTYFYGFNNWTTYGGFSNGGASCTIPDPDVYGTALLCPNTSKIRRLAIDGFLPTTLQLTALTVYSSAGSDQIAYLPRDISGWVFPLVNGHSYRFAWASAKASAYSWEQQWGVTDYLYETYSKGIRESIELDYIPYSFDYIPAAFVNTINGQAVYATEYSSNATRMTQFTSNMGDSYFNATSREVQIMFTNENVDYSGVADPFLVKTESKLCPQSGCYVPADGTINSFGYWSHNSTWTGFGGVPKAGQDMNISANLWVVLDISPPPLGRVFVYGKLSFLSGSSTPITLKVKSLIIYGEVEINGRVTVKDGRNANASSLSPFVGNATITIYGSSSVSVPTVLDEGLYLGSKFIGVVGTLTAIASTPSITQARLNTTSLKGSNTLTVLTSAPLNWTVGQEIGISPTSYFTETGALWSDISPSGIETKRITSISVKQINGQFLSVITVSTSLLKTYSCQNRLGESFCGIVALLSRNIVINSQDISGDDYGFGGHIAVRDVLLTPTIPYYVGTIHLNGVRLKNLGKINGDHYAVSVNYRNYWGSGYSNQILNCAFDGTFNIGVYMLQSQNTTIQGNVIAGGYAGGIYIAPTTKEFTVSSNLVMGIQQNPAVLSNGYAWTLPIAAFNFYSYYGTYFDNIAAGGYDNGFLITLSVFSGRDGTNSPVYSSYTQSLYQAIQQSSPCSTSRGAIIYPYLDNIIQNSIFYGNHEAFACRVGFMVVNRASSESTTTTCAVVTGMKAWRNGHHGILGIDHYANILVTGAVVAENHIGISFSYTRTSDYGFSGVVNSKIIGSLASTATHKCSGGDYAVTGTNWVKQKCQAFSEDDPFGLSSSCHSALTNSQYTRVGILMSQATNAAKSCAIGGDVPLCTVPTFPSRLCSLPWEKRYGLMDGYLYQEQHLHNLTVTGFMGNTSCRGTLGALLALNPTQIDTNPVVVSSSITWEGQDEGLMDIDARLGLVINSADSCSAGDCPGLNRLMIHDHWGFLLDTADSSLPTPHLRAVIHGSILFDNPQYVDSSACHAVPALGLNIFSCIDAVIDSVQPYYTYTALWHNSVEAGVGVVIGPIEIWRTPSLMGYYNLVGGGSNTDVRNYANFNGHFDPCPEIMPTNHFPLIIAAGHYHHVITTGQNPLAWYLRWDNPNADQSAVIDIYIRESNVINVFVGKSISDTFTFIEPIDRTPDLTDSAGTNARNPQQHNVTVTIRGGDYSYYLFRETPTIAVTIKMEMSIAQFFSDTFIANVATLLQISKSRIKITDVRSGSVIVDFEVYPNTTVAADQATVSAQITDLATVATTLVNVSSTGTLSSTLNVTVSRLYYTVVTSVVAVQTNTTTNSSTFTSTKTTVDLVGTFSPTSAPTVAPTAQPTYPVTRLPTSSPTLTPSSEPTSESNGSDSVTSSALIIIISVVVTVCVLILGAIIGYTMSSRVKITAIIPQSNAAVITATTTDMDFVPNYRQHYASGGAGAAAQQHRNPSAIQPTVVPPQGPTSPISQSAAAAIMGSTGRHRAIPQDSHPLTSPLSRHGPTGGRTDRSKAYEVHE